MFLKKKKQPKSQVLIDLENAQLLDLKSDILDSIESLGIASVNLHSFRLLRLRDYMVKNNLSCISLDGDKHNGLVCYLNSGYLTIKRLIPNIEG